MTTALTLRLATEDDIPALHALIEPSVRGSAAADYATAQIESALGTVLGLGTQLSQGKTYFVVEALTQDTKARSPLAGTAAGCTRLKEQLRVLSCQLTETKRRVPLARCNYREVDRSELMV